MADKDPNEKKNMPPLPPGFPRPGVPQPGVPGGAGKPVPPMPGQLRPAPPQLPGGAPSFPFGGGAPRAPQRDAAAEEAARMKEEKDKLEKKINDMEHLLSQEKEKALLATLKSQQDEVLSSKVESSLKDIQDKLRRDRHEQEVAEERMALKAKIKELETKLVQERETWMQTLRGQMQERESASKDVEGHFIFRLQEMERRWLEEKAQWQRNFVLKEEEVRSLKSSAERLREVQDELRLVSLDKVMMEKELSRYKDEMARLERDTARERAAADSYLRSLPDKERELATLRSEVSMAKMREERAVSDFRAREEKLTADIDRLQKEIGSISDRKTAEREEELQKLRAAYEAQLHEKESVIAQVSGEKIRAVSELVKIKGFIARVQAVNAALDKERAALRQEKMQMAQSMAANIEETKKIRQELEHVKGAHQGEIDELVKKHQARVEQIKESYAGDVAKIYNDKLAKAGQEAQEERLSLMKKYQDEIAALASAHQAELSRTAKARQDEEAERARAHQQALAAVREEQARAERAHKEELARVETAAHQKLAAMQEEALRSAKARQDELARLRADAQAEKDSSVSAVRAKCESDIAALRSRIDSEAAEAASAQKKRLEQDHAEQTDKLMAAKAAAEAAAHKSENDALRLAEEVKNLETVLARKQKEFMGAAAEAAGGRKNLEAKIGVLEAEKAGYADRCASFEAQAASLAAEQADLKARLDALAAEKTAKEESLANTEQAYKTESENRARFESELMFLKQKVQQLELQTTDLNSQLETERQSLAEAREAASVDAQNAQAQIEALSAEVEKYKSMENSFAERMKWVLKGKKQGE